LLRDVNQNLRSTILKAAADTGMSVDAVLDWAHNCTGCKAAHIRRKLYS
jgi:hypothetical protein